MQALPEQERAEAGPGDRAAEPLFTLAVKAEGGRVLREISLPARDHLIGRDPICDVIIPDLDADELGILHLDERDGARIVGFTAFVAGMKSDSRVLRIGQRMVLGDHANLRHSGIELTVQSTRPTIFGSSRYARPLLALALSVLLAAFAALIGQDRGQGRGGDPSPAPVFAQDAPEDPGAMMRNAEAELRRRLRIAGLDQSLTAGSDGLRLLLRGRIEDDERPRLLDMLTGARTAIRAPIDVELTSSLQQAALVVAVVVEPQAYILTRGGARLRAGQELQPGVVIQSIEANGILVRRDGLRERIVLSR
jgi:hypothetical protein